MATATVSLPLSVATLNPQFILGSVVGHVVSIFYNCDSDLELFTHGENKLGKIPIIGIFLKILIGMFSLPYAAIVGHRSQYSHMPVLSDAIRYLYLELWIFLFDGIFQYHSTTIFNAIYQSITIGDGQGYLLWIIWISSPEFLGFFLSSVAQTSTHTLILDGGMIEKRNKKTGRNQRHYILGKAWYKRCRKWFDTPTKKQG